MFPNPQDALPLPPRPNLERYRKLAKSLVKASKSGEENAIGDWADHWIRAVAKAYKPRWIDGWIDQVEEFARRKLAEKGSLTSAQFVIARSHGFESWPRFSKHLEALSQKASSASRFEAAADAIVTGDIAALKRLLREDPRLIHAKSTREHDSTLLHYTSANGVESYRQKTPKNIVKITQLLLDAGAEVDAISNVYGDGCTTLGLAATSVHPEQAGVQEPLLQLLLDHGAKLDQSPIAGNRHSIVMACIANGRPNAAEFLANRGAHLDLAGAAALGRLDLVKSLFDEKQLTKAFLNACAQGRNSVVEFLLEKGPDLSAHSGDGQTALHYACIGGHPETVKLLLPHNPPLELKNVYGGTMLGQTLWSAAHGGDPNVYIEIIEALIAAGAKLPELHVPVNKRIDEWLAKHGSRAEPTWYWFGEKPRKR
jgi:ankyrin repeat protein